MPALLLAILVGLGPPSAAAGPAPPTSCSSAPRPSAAPDVAQALREAALAVRADPRQRHPFYWAGFSLVGRARLHAR